MQWGRPEAVRPGQLRENQRGAPRIDWGWREARS
eukprot:gene150-15483_t